MYVFNISSHIFMLLTPLNINGCLTSNLFLIISQVPADVFEEQIRYC
jgi:hypothetical protein